MAKRPYVNRVLIVNGKSMAGASLWGGLDRKSIAREAQPNSRRNAPCGNGPVRHSGAGAQAGAYIIVSATGSTADGALANRRKAMQDAVEDIARRDELALDFYDRGRVATWVRGHPGLIPWVRTRIGKSLSGWQPHGQWAQTLAGSDNSYLVDDVLRVQTSSAEDGDGVTALAGLERIRYLLGEPGKVVRLVGLSGVGKPHFVQAIFDPAIGRRSLDPSPLAVCADMADTPDPQSITLASNPVVQRM